jgi:hypothetical protein
MSDETIQGLADELVQAAWPLIEAGRKGKPSIATVKTILAPYLRRSMKGCLDATAGPDGRAKPFLVTGKFFDMARGKDAAHLIGETDEDEAIVSQAGIFEALAGWLEELHADEELSEDASLEGLSKKSASLRSMLSRGNGVCTLRVNYEADGVPHLAQVRVKRAEDD